MYRLESILPEEEFHKLISEFSIGRAQAWLDDVRGSIGVSCYDRIKKEFRAEEASKKEKLAEMNCLLDRKASESRETIFQESIGAEKHVDIDGIGVDNLFTSLFAGI